MKNSFLKNNYTHLHAPTSCLWQDSNLDIVWRTMFPYLKYIYINKVEGRYIHFNCCSIYYRDRSTFCWPCFLSTYSNTVCFHNCCVSLSSISLFWTSSLPHEQQGTCQWCILSFYSRFSPAFISVTPFSFMIRVKHLNIIHVSGSFSMLWPWFECYISHNF